MGEGKTYSPKAALVMHRNLISLPAMLQPLCECEGCEGCGGCGPCGDAEVAGSGAGSRRRPGVGGLVLDSNEETAFTAPPHQR